MWASEFFCLKLKTWSQAPFLDCLYICLVPKGQKGSLPQELVILSGSWEQSQIHRTSEIIWSRPSPFPELIWRSSGPMPLLRAGSVRAGYSGSYPVGFWVSPRMATPQPLWATSFCVWSSVKKFHFLFKWNLSYFSLCLLSLVLSLGTTVKSLDPPLHLPSGIHTHWQDAPLSVPFSRLNSSSSPSLLSHERCYSPLITFVALS